MYFFYIYKTICIFKLSKKVFFQSSYWDYGVIFGSHGYLGVRLETVLPGMNFCHFWSTLYFTQWFPEGNIMICSSKKKTLLDTWDRRPKTCSDWATTVDMAPVVPLKVQRSWWAPRSAKPRPLRRTRPATRPWLRLRTAPLPPLLSNLLRCPRPSSCVCSFLSPSRLPAPLDDPQGSLPPVSFCSLDHQTTRVSRVLPLRIRSNPALTDAGAVPIATASRKYVSTRKRKSFAQSAEEQLFAPVRFESTWVRCRRAGGCKPAAARGALFQARGSRATPLPPVGVDSRAVRWTPPRSQVRTPILMTLLSQTER